MNLNVKTDISGAMFKLKSYSTEGRAAMASALNRTVVMANTAARQEIQSVYNLKAKDFKTHNEKGKVTGSKVVIKRATKNNLFSKINILGRRLGLYLFAAKNTKVGLLDTKKTGKRVTVEIKRGHRFILNRAFIAPWRAGSKLLWVMERDKSKGKSIQRKSPTSGIPYETYPRKVLFTKSLPELYSTKRVGAVIRAVAKANFDRIFKHEFMARIRGFVKVKKAA